MIYTYIMFKKKISWGLALFAAASLLSCSKDALPTPPCLGGDCDARMIFPADKDANGYYHIKLDWSREYLPYFIIDVEASTISPEYRYNDISFVQANFHSDTSWVIGDTLVMQVPLFKPFTGNWTQTGNLIPSSIVDLPLTQFAGIEVNVVQSATIQFSEDNGVLKSRRVVGPFIPTMIGDTVTIAMKVKWDAMYEKIQKDNFVEKFIVE